MNDIKMNQNNYMKYRDLVYENLNIEYNEQFPEGGIKCKNYQLCKNILPINQWEYLACYLCMCCGSWFKIGGFGWNELEFKENNEECIICNNTDDIKVKFPANCGHWFCVNCSRKILFWDETRYHLSPVLFGCPPCPNKCVNPEKGTQCYCEEYDEIIEQWKQENPKKYEDWNEAEHLSIDLGETEPGSIFGSCKCPLCRKEYIRNNN